MSLNISVAILSELGSICNPCICCQRARRGFASWNEKPFRNSFAVLFGTGVQTRLRCSFANVWTFDSEKRVIYLVVNQGAIRKRNVTNCCGVGTRVRAQYTCLAPEERESRNH